MINSIGEEILSYIAKSKEAQRRLQMGINELFKLREDLAIALNLAGTPKELLSRALESVTGHINCLDYLQTNLNLAIGKQKAHPFMP